MLTFFHALVDPGRIASGTAPSRPDDLLTPSGQRYVSVKAVLDFLLAVLLLLLTAPLIGLALVLVKLTSPGPVMYAQVRLGRHGQPFTLYKIRTMTHDCESLTGARWSMPGDTRVTPLGRLLRRTHLDELPQLWNVLRGDMSLIGPRPERPEFLPQLEHAIPHYRKRLQVRPGVTGLAQVQLPPDTDLESVFIKTAYDLHYIRTLGLFLDLRIYWATFFKMNGIKFERLRKLFRFPTRATIEAGYQDLVPASRKKPASTGVDSEHSTAVQAAS